MNICQRNPKWLSVTVGLLLAVTQVQAAVGGPDLPDPGNPGMTRQEQIQIGYQTAAQVYKQMPVLPDSSPETQYIRQLGEKLAATIPQQYSWPFQFHVIAQKEINAFALPGGPMFVNIGTITAADNEAELVAVMAHEMAHVYMQHSAKQATGKSSVVAGLAGLAGAILGAGGFLGQLASLGIQVGAQGIIMKYSRTDESQADAVGAIIMYKAGYNPQAMADFFQKLAEEGGAGGPTFLSDHPNPGNREAAIQKEIAGWPRKNYQTNSQQFIQVKQQAGGVKAYSGEQIAQGAKTGEWAALNQRNGAVFQAPAGVKVSPPASTMGGSARNASLQSVLPSSRMVNQNLGSVLRIARPENWQVMTPSQRGGDVMIAPQSGVTDNGIGYGVAINGVSAQGQAMSVDRITSELMSEWERGRGMRAIDGPQPIRVGNVEGRSATMESTSPFLDEGGQPQKERDWLVTMPQSDGSVLYMVFIAPQSQFSRFRPTFENMLRSVEF